MTKTKKNSRPEPRTSKSRYQLTTATITSIAGFSNVKANGVKHYSFVLKLSVIVNRIYQSFQYYNQ